MSEPIKVGDLVMVVLWPHRCINPIVPIGKVFVVRAIVSDAHDGFCRRCGETISNSCISAQGATSGNASIPISWLKRIDPLAEPETVETDETVKA